jgi:hypothetical protein
METYASRCLGSTTEQAVVLLHERVHQFLAPKLYLLREYRANARGKSYFHSSLWRYIEEAMCETVAQVGVNGFRKFFVGIKFPVGNGYMFLTKGGGFESEFTGFGLLPEAAALIYNGMVYGIVIELRFAPQSPPVREN